LLYAKLLLIFIDIKFVLLFNFQKSQKMSGNKVPANQAGKKGATGANKTAATNNAAATQTAAPAANAPAAPAAKADEPAANAPAAPAANDAAKVATNVAAPAKPKLEFKIGKKQLPTGKRGGGKRGSKYTSGTLLKFAEAPYGNIGEHLRHVLNGLAMIMFPHTSGFFADNNGVQTEQAVPEGTTTYATLAEAVAARSIVFAYAEGEHFIGYAQNNKLPEGCKTSKPDQAYHCFLTATSAEEIEKAVENLNAFKAIPGAALFNVDKNLVFLTDGEGNIVAERLAEPVLAQPATIAAAAPAAEGETANAENTEDAPAAEATADANAEATEVVEA
jgi:hypothetical protein